MSIYKNGKLIAGLSISYHPDLFDWKWADHKLNDVQWLRADSFSWHNASMYQAAYQHLADDILGKTLQSETVSGTTIQFYLSDDGHKICPASEESNVTAIYNATGVAWYYIIDTTNQRFKLPRTKFGVTGLRDTVGKYVEAGLPNITGNAGHAWTGGTSGAFYQETSYQTSAWGYNADRPLIKFDASRSSSIYGNSDTVQPKATEMYLYFYVGSFTQTALENTAGVVTEDFNELNAHKVVEFQAPTAANNYTWYRKYADGWVEQGGIKKLIANNSNYLQSLPITMADGNYTVTIAQCTTDDSGYEVFYSNQACVLARTITTVTLSNRRFNGSGTYTLDIMWQVSGMAAN